jgi:hypothetical protein
MQKPRATNFCTVVPNTVNIITAIFLPTDNNVHQFTCTEHRTPDNSEAHTSVQDGGASLRNLLHAILLVLRKRKWLLDFWTICGTLIPAPPAIIIIIIIIIMKVIRMIIIVAFSHFVVPAVRKLFCAM